MRHWVIVGGAVLVGLLVLMLWSCLVMAGIRSRAEEAAARITGCKPVPPGEYE